MNGVQDIGSSSGFGPVTDHSKAEPTFHERPGRAGPSASQSVSTMPAGPNDES